MFIRSERLFLRPAWPEDWKELHPLIADEGIVRNLARAPWPYTEGCAREFTARAQRWMLPEFLVTLPGGEGSRIIGGCGLHERDGQPELGYWIAREHWGRGYASEAARAVLSIARTLGHRRIFAGHFADNPASGRVLRKAGFRPTGEIRESFSLARGCTAPSVEHVVELGESLGGEDGDGFNRIAA